jgi:hypothetical protein
VESALPATFARPLCGGYCRKFLEAACWGIGCALRPQAPLGTQIVSRGTAAYFYDGACLGRTRGWCCLDFRLMLCSDAFGRLGTGGAHGGDISSMQSIHLHIWVCKELVASWYWESESERGRSARSGEGLNLAPVSSTQVWREYGALAMRDPGGAWRSGSFHHLLFFLLFSTRDTVEKRVLSGARLISQDA